MAVCDVPTSSTCALQTTLVFFRRTYATLASHLARCVATQHHACLGHDCVAPTVAQQIPSIVAVCPGDTAVCCDTGETTETQVWAVAAGHMGETCRDTDVVLEKAVHQGVCVVSCHASAPCDTSQEIETVLVQLAFHVSRQTETDAISSVVGATQSVATRVGTVETHRDTEKQADAVSDTSVAQSQDTVSRHAKGVSSLVATRDGVVHAATHFIACLETNLPYQTSACRVAYLGQ